VVYFTFQVNAIKLEDTEEVR